MWMMFSCCSDETDSASRSKRMANCESCATEVLSALMATVRLRLSWTAL